MAHKDEHRSSLALPILLSDKIILTHLRRCQRGTGVLEYTTMESCS